jgi:hypothetical protein
LCSMSRLPNITSISAVAQKVNLGNLGMRPNEGVL